MTDKISLLMELLAIDGGSGDEGRVSEFIQARLIDAGLDPALIVEDNAHELAGSGTTGNLIVKLPGTQDGPRLLLSAHMDTVDICRGAVPKQENGFITSTDPEKGLGADDRAGCAVLLWTLLRLLDEKPDHPPLTFLWTVQEEIGMIGARGVDVEILGNPEAGLNYDGPFAINYAAIGSDYFEIIIRGIPSHAGVAPEQGVNALTAASIAISSLQSAGWLGAVDQQGLRGSANVGVVRGGNGVNVVMPDLYLKGEVRSHQKDDRTAILAEIEKAFSESVALLENSEGQTGSFEMKVDPRYEAFRLEADHPLVQKASEVFQSLGQTPEVVVLNGGLDANRLNDKDITTVNIGVGYTGAHTDQESQSVELFSAVCDFTLVMAQQGI